MKWTSISARGMVRLLIVSGASAVASIFIALSLVFGRALPVRSYALNPRHVAAVMAAETGVESFDEVSGYAYARIGWTQTEMLVQKDGHEWYYESLESGLPFACLRGTIVRRDGVVSARGVLPTSLEAYHQQVYLPTSVRLVGLLANSTVMSIVVCAAWWTLSKIRRGSRIRHGLCTVCRYPVGAHYVCTECGSPRKASRNH